jgi:HSP20 family molecular chaperone IbpA
VDENKTEARFSNGVLTVTMTKSQEAKAKTNKVPVKNA